MVQTLLICAEQVRSVFGLREAFRSQELAFECLGTDRARLAPRVLLSGFGDPPDTAFSYVARTAPGTGPVCKFGSVNAANPRRAMPAVSAIIVALDPQTGCPVAILDGASITELRTSAATAVAARHLVHARADRLVVMGCGVQGRAHVRALCDTLALEAVTVWSPDPAERRQVASQLSTELGRQIQDTDDLAGSVRDASIVATCTTSKDPVLRTSWLTPGCTVLSVGSFAPDRRETDQDLLQRAALIVVDDVETACTQAGPIVEGLRDGSITRADLTPLHDVVVGRAHRRSPRDIVYFNSVGLGIQDAAAAWSVIRAVTGNADGRTFDFTGGPREALPSSR